MQKFENMDVIAALEAIMHQNTAYYQSDFAYDIKMLREATRSDQPEGSKLYYLRDRVGKAAKVKEQIR